MSKFKISLVKKKIKIIPTSFNNYTSNDFPQSQKKHTFNIALNLIPLTVWKYWNMQMNWTESNWFFGIYSMLIMTILLQKDEQNVQSDMKL